jgi:hypothetical protein
METILGSEREPSGALFRMTSRKRVFGWPGLLVVRVSTPSRLQIGELPPDDLDFHEILQPFFNRKFVRFRRESEKLQSLSFPAFLQILQDTV